MVRLGPLRLQLIQRLSLEGLPVMRFGLERRRFFSPNFMVPLVIALVLRISWEGGTFRKCCGTGLLEVYRQNLVGASLGMDF